MPAYKVYISSTYQDLKLHRQAVWSVFLKNTECFEVHAMEGYVAESTTPLSKCLADVAACNLYILILSNRYGYIPDDPVANPDGLSITQLEYQTAYDRYKQGLCKLLCFMASDDESLFPFDSPNPDDPKRKKMEAFRQVVGTDFLCGDPFRYDYELRATVQDALIRVLSLQLQPVTAHLHDIVQYCCDRRPQLVNFWRQNRAEQTFAVYEIRSQTDDLGDNFIKRLGWEFMDWQRLNRIPYFSSGDLFTSTNFERFKQNFFTSLYYVLTHTQPVDEVTLETILQNWKHPYLVVSFLFSEDVGLINTDRWALLMRLCADIEQAMRGRTLPRIFFFINVESNEPEPTPTTDGPSALYRIDLNALSYADLKIWFYTFVREDQGLFNRVAQQFFTQSKEARPLTMSVAEDELKALIKQCNRAEQFIDYLENL